MSEHEPGGARGDLLQGIDAIEDAERVAAAYVDALSGHDGFFSQESTHLLADYLFAASREHVDPSILFEWLQEEEHPVPAAILGSEYPEISARIRAVQAMPERTRSGIFATVRLALAEEQPEAQDA